MVYTKEEFKRLWNSGADGGGITCDDVADCAEAWGLFRRPRCARMDDVIAAVVEAAGCDEKQQSSALWHKWPQEKPSRTGEYLIRGIGGLNNKLHHWVCLWVGETEYSEISCKFFYGGNEFCECQSFEWVDVNKL